MAGQVLVATVQQAPQAPNLHMYIDVVVVVVLKCCYMRFVAPLYLLYLYYLFIHERGARVFSSVDPWLFYNLIFELTFFTPEIKQ